MFNTDVEYFFLIILKTIVAVLILTLKVVKTRACNAFGINDYNVTSIRVTAAKRIIDSVYQHLC